MFLQPQTSAVSAAASIAVMSMRYISILSMAVRMALMWSSRSKTVVKASRIAWAVSLSIRISILIRRIRLRGAGY